MRILHVYKDYFPVIGGIENHVRMLAESQAAAGHHVTVLACSRGLHSERTTLNGVAVLQAGRLATVSSMPVSAALFSSRGMIQGDITHLHSPFPLGEAANHWRGRSQATVITHHADIVRQRLGLACYKPLLNAVLDRADAIIATSPRYLDTSPWLAPRRAKCHVVPLGIDHRCFRPDGAPAKDGDRAMFELLFVGRLRYYKGIGTLLRAVAAVPGTRLTIVGSGPLQRQWQRDAVRLGLGARVRFLGDVPEAGLPRQYRSADAFVLPADSRAEAFGTVLLEAMACGLPCIATEIGTGTSWVVRHGETGLVVPPGQPGPLAAAIERLANDPASRTAYGAAGRRRVEDFFTLDMMVDGVQHVYEAALSRQS